jgi:Xaa-Pro aminopeptidase
LRINFATANDLISEKLKSFSDRKEFPNGQCRSRLFPLAVSVQRADYRLMKASMPDIPNLAKRRARVANALQLTDEILLVGAGEPVPLPENTDQTYPFRSHTEYFYLTGMDSPGGVIAFDPQDRPGKRWVSFVPDVTEAERTWEGRTQEVGKSLTALEGWLTARRGRPLVNLGERLRGVRSDDALIVRAREQFTHARRAKDTAELRLLRRAANATEKGFSAVREYLRPGVTERALQIELEAAFFRAGADRVGYGTIVASGPNAAVMHFSPSRRKVRRGDFVLIDAGAEVGRYVIDVTRTFVAGEKASPFQRDLLQLVLTVEEAAISRCVPDAEWKTIHLQAATELTAGLVEMNVMRGRPESLVEQGAHTLFFPHGLGHLVGLGVRDASGRFPGRAKDDSAALKNLRMDLPLAAGYVTTVEPGVYFIPAILNDSARRRRYRTCVNWSLADAHIGIGGVRIEDDVLVTNHQPEVLTAGVAKNW